MLVLSFYLSRKDNTYLSIFSDLQHNIVVQYIDGIVHGTDRKISGPFQTNLDVEMSRWRVLSQTNSNPFRTCSSHIYSMYGAGLPKFGPREPQSSLSDQSTHLTFSKCQLQKLSGSTEEFKYSYFHITRRSTRSVTSPVLCACWYHMSEVVLMSNHCFPALWRWSRCGPLFWSSSHRQSRSNHFCQLQSLSREEKKHITKAQHLISHFLLSSFVVFISEMYMSRHHCHQLPPASVFTRVFCVGSASSHQFICV